MAETALHKLLHGKKGKSGPVVWIKINRNRAYRHLVVPPCFKCDSADAEIVWFNCQSGVRCLGCRDDIGEEVEALLSRPDAP